MKLFTFLFCFCIYFSALCQKSKKDEKSYTETITESAFQFEMKQPLILSKKVKAYLLIHDEKVNADKTDTYMYSVKILNPFKSGKKDAVLYVKVMTMTGPDNKPFDVEIDLKASHREGDYLIYPMWNGFLKTTSLENLTTARLYDTNTGKGIELKITEDDKKNVLNFITEVFIRLVELADEMDEDKY